MADHGLSADSADSADSANATTALGTKEWSANGTGADAAQAAADRPDEAADEATDARAATDDAFGDDGSAFLDELVRAMQTTALAEKTRIAEDTDRRREAHLATVAARREAGATTMRTLADDDLKAIDAWADEERERIQAERERRATAVQTDLATSLAAHAAKIDAEVDAVETAITGYRTEVDAFFAALDQETDPVAIARHASRRPAFPVLETIGVTDPGPETAADSTAETEGAADAEAVPQTESVGEVVADGENQPVAEAEAVPETESVAGGTAADATETPDEPAIDPTPVVAVMEPRSATKLAESWAAWSGISAAPAETGDRAADSVAVADADGDAPAGAASTSDAPSDDESSEPVALEPAAVVSGKGKVLQSVPSSRPMSWLRRDRDVDDRQNGDH